MHAQFGDVLFGRRNNISFHSLILLIPMYMIVEKIFLKSTLTDFERANLAIRTVTQ